MSLMVVRVLRAVQSNGNGGYGEEAADTLPTDMSDTSDSEPDNKHKLVLSHATNACRVHTVGTRPSYYYILLHIDWQWELAPSLYNNIVKS